MKVSQILKKWYEGHKRHLPWREDIDPYKVWISEIVLQQTRVNQGLPYYYRFIEKFPDIATLATATLDDVLLLWEGLGYYTRARNLHKTARVIYNDCKGVFPNEYKKIRSLFGIGEYTAAAIASLAFNLPYAAVDGNVYRVIARLYGIDTTINSMAGKKQFQKLADDMLDAKNPGMHNQAMIELGALVCLPKKPKCSDCPLCKMCYAYNNDTIYQFPVKTKPSTVKHRYLYYLVYQHKNGYYIRQRGDKDIWAQLYEFPNIELEHPAEIEEIIGSEHWKKLIGNMPVQIKKMSNEYKHQLSHQLIHAWFITFNSDEEIMHRELRWVSQSDLSSYAFPKLIVNFLSDFRLRN